MALDADTTARDDAEVRRRHEANRVAWNEGAQHYTVANEERITGLRAGRSTLHPVERAMLGDLRTWCGTAVHLQCASGQDTFSLWLEGAKRVVGVDISDAHIENARLTSDALGAPAEWFRCDILDTPHELDGTADLVFTGRGAIDWLHDIEGWAGVCARLLKPGGIVTVFDNHPVVYLFDPDADHIRFLGIDYFDTPRALKAGAPTTSAKRSGRPRSSRPRSSSARGRPCRFCPYRGRPEGRAVRRVHPDPYFEIFPRVPPEERRQIPHTFSMLARTPRA